jgi:hypothetical protein
MRNSRMFHYPAIRFAREAHKTPGPAITAAVKEPVPQTLLRLSAEEAHASFVEIR